MGCLMRFYLIISMLLVLRALAADSDSNLPRPEQSTSDSGPKRLDGPLFQYRLEGDLEAWSFSPFISHVSDPGTDSEELDVLYPLFSLDRFGLEYRCHFFQLLSWSGGGAADDHQTRRFTIFPFYFQQRSSDPSKNYTALLPFYGTIRGRLFRDEFKAVLAPLYVRTRKKDVVTDNFLMPFFHLRHGQHVQGWQFWPIFGHETRSPSTITNGFGESEIVPGHRKTMALWPFFFSQHLGLGTNGGQRRLAALPFFNLERSEQRDSTTWFWPFGYTLTHDRAKKYREQAVLYPFITWADGNGKNSMRVWPFFSRTRTPTVSRDSYLWPLFRKDHAETEALERDRSRVLMFVYSDLQEKNKATGAELRRTDLWPLFHARRDMAGRSVLQFPALIESYLPGNKSVERNWSPVWAVYRREENTKDKTVRSAWLWNMFRWEQSPEFKKGSLLFGLLRYQAGGGETRWRWGAWPSEPKAKPSDGR